MYIKFKLLRALLATGIAKKPFTQKFKTCLKSSVDMSVKSSIEEKTVYYCYFNTAVTRTENNKIGTKEIYSGFRSKILPVIL